MGKLTDEKGGFTAPELWTAFNEGGDTDIGSINGVGGLLRHFWRELGVLECQFGTYRVRAPKLIRTSS